MSNVLERRKETASYRTRETRMALVAHWANHGCRSRNSERLLEGSRSSGMTAAFWRKRILARPANEATRDFRACSPKRNRTPFFCHSNPCATANKENAWCIWTDARKWKPLITACRRVGSGVRSSCNETCCMCGSCIPTPASTSVGRFWTDLRWPLFDWLPRLWVSDWWPCKYAQYRYRGQELSLQA